MCEVALCESFCGQPWEVFGILKADCFCWLKKKTDFRQMFCHLKHYQICMCKQWSLEFMLNFVKYFGCNNSNLFCMPENTNNWKSEAETLPYFASTSRVICPVSGIACWQSRDFTRIRWLRMVLLVLHSHCTLPLEYIHNATSSH